MAKKEENKSYGKTIIMSCTCSHKAQDEMYGYRRRVWNIGKKYYTCTSCGQEALN